MEEIKLVRKYSDDLPSKKYESTKFKGIDNLHWGQRKLLFSEIDCLTRYYDRFDHTQQKYILYIGASPGHHINYLIKMFPDIKFFLYDRVETGVHDKRATFFRKYFDDNEAQKYKNMNIFIFCDIRNLEIRRYQKKSISEEEAAEGSDRVIFDDMAKQKDWCEIIKPKCALLKFRLSWNTPTTTYYDGDLYFQPWNKNNSTELRLVPYFDKPLKVWDNKKIEEIVFYYNTVTRRQKIPDEMMKLGSCLGRYYDGLIEVDILKKYIEKFEPDVSDIGNRICDISLSITMELSKGTKKKISSKYLKDVPIDEKYDPESEEVSEVFNLKV